MRGRPLIIWGAWCGFSWTNIWDWYHGNFFGSFLLLFIFRQFSMTLRTNFFSILNHVTQMINGRLINKYWLLHEDEHSMRLISDIKLNEANWGGVDKEKYFFIFWQFFMTLRTNFFFVLNHVSQMINGRLINKYCLLHADEHSMRWSQTTVNGANWGGVDIDKDKSRAYTMHLQSSIAITWLEN